MGISYFRDLLNVMTVALLAHTCVKEGTLAERRISASVCQQEHSEVPHMISSLNMQLSKQVDGCWPTNMYTHNIENGRNHTSRKFWVTTDSKIIYL